MEETGIIYKIENLINKKVYIGQTIQPFQKRKDAHIYELRKGTKTNRKFQNAWNKYREENFKFEVIERCRKSELNHRERYYVNKYNSYCNGYNLTTGGQKNFKHSHNEGTKEKLSKIGKILWKDEEHREKMMQRPIYSGNKAPRAIKVICINDKKVFGCMVEAAEYYGITKSQVSECCLENTAYTGLEETGVKLQFAYYEEGKQYVLKDITHINERKKVICISTNEIFDSISEAGEKTGAPKASISHVCRGNRKRAGGLEWMFLEDYEALI